jgi:hypothetical protein
MSAVIGMVAVFALIVVGLRRQMPGLTLMGFALWVFLIFFSPRGWRPPSWREVFRSVICNPIPESVKDVRATFDRSVQGGYATLSYRMAFSVSSNDLERIIHAKPFEAKEVGALPTKDLDWFRPESMGGNARTYVYAWINGRDVLWIDETGTNCLYLYESVKTSYQKVSHRL